MHTLCGAFWLASLVPLIWSLSLPTAAAHVVLDRFSAVAAAMAAALVFAGIALAWVQLGGGIAPSWETPYGLRLAGKLALVGGLLALAAINRFALTLRSGATIRGHGVTCAGRLQWIWRLVSGCWP